MLTLTPVALATANAFVNAHHRHHKATAGHKFSIGCAKDGELVGVAIVGRPVSRYLDDGWTLEVNRLCTTGERNACSILYAASARAAKAMGYRKIITYTLDSENGSSLRAAGWSCAGMAGGKCWTGSRKPASALYPAQMKLRYERPLQGGISMAYVNAPKDLTKAKTKVLFNLTKRQLICFGSGALIGVPLFFLLKGSIGTSPAAMVMMVVMIPAMLFAMYEKNGQPLEVVIRNIYRVCFQRPKQRPYKTNNFYAVLERQNQLDREVYQIVRKEKADPRRTKTDRSRHRKSEPNG